MDKIEYENNPFLVRGFLKDEWFSGTTTARRTIQALIDKGLVLAIPQKNLAREY